MPAPTSATYSAAAKIAAHATFLALIDAGTGPGSLKIRSSSDVLLAQIPFLDPAGVVNGTTGQLVFDMDGRDESAAASGTAAYGEFCDSDDVVHLSLPAESGAAPVSGKLVMNSLTIVAGSPVEISTAIIG